MKRQWKWRTTTTSGCSIFDQDGRRVARDVKLANARLITKLVNEAEHLDGSELGDEHREVKND